MSSYPNERGLQLLLVEEPTLIPGVGPAAVVEELQLPNGGAVDVVAIEPSGGITLVECKLAANSEVRRAVVGQVLSYAASLWQMPYDQFDRLFHRRAGASLTERVGHAAAEADLDFDAEEFRRATAEQLASGAFRLFIAVDEITDELKSIVEYLNVHTTSELEVLALELAYIVHGDTEILLPRTHGSETARIKSSSSDRSRHKWRTEDVFSRLTEFCSDAGVGAVRTLYDDVCARGGRVYPGTGSFPTMSGYLELNDQQQRALRAVYADPSERGASRMSLNFGSWRNELDDAELDALTSRLESSPVLAPLIADVREQDYNTYPTVRIDQHLAQPGVVDTIIAALDPHLPPRTDQA